MDGARELVELGSGMASKTRALLYAMAGPGRSERYVPFDVDESVVEQCADELAELYPGLTVHGVVGDFERDLTPDPRRASTGCSRSWAGRSATSTRPSASAFLRDAARADGAHRPAADRHRPGEGPRVLEAAYDDSEGVTAEFNRNVLRVLNRELGADFDPDAFEHVAFFDEANSWIEMRLRANGAQTVTIDGADLVVEFADGEEMRTEISAQVHPRARCGASWTARACGSTRSTPTTAACSGWRRRRSP